MSHEVLLIVSGRAKVCFGHEDNAQNITTTLTRGDALLIPAGVAHGMIEDLDGGFLMVGAYPEGCEWDMCYGLPEEKERVSKIAQVKWFKIDPVLGDKTPLPELWR